MSQKREFTGVFIPAHIWVSKELTPNEKFILAEMISLNQQDADPDSIQEHLLGIMQCTEDCLIDSLLNLQKLGYIVMDKEQGKMWLTNLVMSKI